MIGMSREGERQVLQATPEEPSSRAPRDQRGGLAVGRASQESIQRVCTTADVRFDTFLRLER